MVVEGILIKKLLTENQAWSLGNLRELSEEIHIVAVLAKIDQFSIKDSSLIIFLVVEAGEELLCTLY